MRDEEKYLNWYADNYDKLKDKLIRFCLNKQLKFDEDVFADTMLKVYEKIASNGINDNTEKGFEDYTFIAFKINTKRESEYARNKNRVEGNPNDFRKGIPSDSDRIDKLRRDTWEDFVTLYTMIAVFNHFPTEDFIIFKKKYLDSMTYKQLAEMTGRKGLKNKVKEMRDWVKENVDIKALRNEFEQILQAR